MRASPNADDAARTPRQASAVDAGCGGGCRFGPTADYADGADIGAHRVVATRAGAHAAEAGLTVLEVTSDVLSAPDPPTGTLPWTGSQVAPYAGMIAVLLLIGTGLVIARRRTRVAVGVRTGADSGAGEG